MISMPYSNQKLSRRNYLHLSALCLGSLALRPFGRLYQLAQFPEGNRLGRVNAGKVELKMRPDIESQTAGTLYEDAVVPCIKESVGVNLYRNNQRFVETPEGYIWSPYLQPVQNHTNPPVSSLPETRFGPGMWVEVSVPYVDLVLDSPPARSPGLKGRLDAGQLPRFYYSQLSWVVRIKIDMEGNAWYRISEPYGSYGDIFWGRGEAFHPLSRDEMAPINPEIEEKRVVVNIPYQTLSCYEKNTEVFFTRISSGALWNASSNQVDVWAIPVGNFPIWRKLVSLHMSGGTTGSGWDIPAIGWTTLFVGKGVAIHSTFWHNNFGEPMSHGCVNARPDDARWIFRWTQPVVNYDPGDVTVPWSGGTRVEVVDV